MNAGMAKEEYVCTYRLSIQLNSFQSSGLDEIISSPRRLKHHSVSQFEKD